MRLPLFTVFIAFLLGLGGAETSHAAPCTVAAQQASLENVVIQPGNETPFKLHLEHLPIEATLSGKSEAELHVNGPLRFSTRHKWTKLDVRTGRRTVLLGGRLVLPEGISGDVLLADRHDAQSSTIPLLPPLSGLIPTTPLLVPCAKLTLGSETPIGRVLPSRTSAKTTALWATRATDFALYRGPKVAMPWSITFEGPLEVLARRGEWVKLRATWSNGARLQGWARSELFSFTATPRLEGHMSGNLIGHGACGRSHQRVPNRFLLKPNAPIHASANGAIWAHATATTEVKAFSLSRSDGWLQIAEVRGFPKGHCADHERFWVHASQIQWTDRPLENE